MRPVIASIQSLRGLAVLMVLGFHLRVVEQAWGGGDRLLPDAALVGAFGVDLFFVISGFIMAFVTRGASASPSTARHFLLQRVTRIYPLYWVYSLAVLALYLARPGMVNSQQDHVDIVASLLLMPQPNLPLLPVAWSLVYEMYFYCVFALLLLLPRHWLGGALELWGALTVAGNALFSFPDAYFMPSASALAISPFTLEFIFGCALGRLVAAPGELRYARCALAGAALWLAAGYAVLCALPHEGGRFAFGESGEPAGWLRWALWAPAAVALVYGAAALERGTGTILLRRLRGIGDASYSIYLSHLLVLIALGRLWGAIAVPGLIDNAAWIGIATLAALAWAWLSYRLLELPLRAVTRAGAPRGDRIPMALSRKATS